MESFDFENTEINELMEQITNANHILTSKVELRAKFKEKVKKEGYVYDSEAKKYKLPQKETEENESKKTESNEEKNSQENQQEKTSALVVYDKEVKKYVPDNSEPAQQLEVSARQ